ncbi:LOW QUALITY PROTEIN: protein argonaute-2-like [Glossina fuscipes]|uniref:LOW QUALITY PROTEIN: protein argonaute-2-like n=1 Tax=Glossina fuscipes TaxID=7396 RepID=A0A8U0WMW7_9MUSC|nr:LOW QUALITY PROTEIN: protein argonaute-2-like [Glossina fuscipes]
MENKRKTSQTKVNEESKDSPRNEKQPQSPRQWARDSQGRQQEQNRSKSRGRGSQKSSKQQWKEEACGEKQESGTVDSVRHKQDNGGGRRGKCLERAHWEIPQEQPSLQMSKVQSNKQTQRGNDAWQLQQACKEQLHQSTQISSPDRIKQQAAVILNQPSGCAHRNDQKQEATGDEGWGSKNYFGSAHPGQFVARAGRCRRTRQQHPESGDCNLQQVGQSQSQQTKQKVSPEVWRHQSSATATQQGATAKSVGQYWDSEGRPGGAVQEEYREGAWGGQQIRPQHCETDKGKTQQHKQKVSPNQKASGAGHCAVEGTIGRRGVCEVNYLRMNIDKMPDVAYHYDVSIKPDRPKNFLWPIFDQCQKQHFGDIAMAFDGSKSCYSLQLLPKKSYEFFIDVVDGATRTKTFEIQIKQTGVPEVDLASLRSYHNELVFDKPMRALQALEVVLASNNHALGIRSGRSFYRKPDEYYDWGDGYEMYTGIYQAAILGEVPLLNVDISHKSFPKPQSLVQCLKYYKIDPRYTMADGRIKKFIQQFLKAIYITYYMPPPSFGALPKIYKVLDIDDAPARITTRPKKREISLPMEFCSVTENQVLNRKNGSIQVTKMIKYATTSTDERKNKIMNLLTHFCHSQSPTIRAFGIQLGSNFIKIHFRLLSPPDVEYCGGKTVRPCEGAWQVTNAKFLETVNAQPGHKWAIIYENKASISMHVVMEFKKTAVVVISYGASYSMIKQKAELRVGILTQCIKEKTVSRAYTDMSVMRNLMLKLSAKLNGTNHKVAEEKEEGIRKLLQSIRNVMFIGADVTHPSPDQRHIPSVVGVAASHNAHGPCYNTQYRLQMKSIIEDVLDVYKSYQDRYPDHIIYYRDGVSDGQFPIVRREEFRGIRHACAQLGCRAKVTCIVVVKRHYTRFFPLPQGKGGRDFNNVEPGTVVDQYIVHPNEKQFFLVSHKAIQGTARPTRYNIIEDDANFDIDVLQKLTYNMCHMFPRCNMAVSYPAPAYLAHLVAFRGRVYLEGSATRFGNLKDEYRRRRVHPSLKKCNPMFFI